MPHGGDEPDVNEVPDGALNDTIATGPRLRTDGPVIAAGTVLADRYEVRVQLGSGGMGDVFEAFDRQLEESVALKWLAGTAPKMIERFHSEVRLSRRVTHRNVARTYDLGVHDDLPFLTMELINGPTLEDHLARIGRLPPSDARSIAMDICRGLAAAHEAGVVHRDLKPANIMLSDDGRVLLTDFGIARALQGPAVTGNATLLGTPIYMAPEQVTGQAVDHRADLYAFGVLLFEMVTGLVPFGGDTPIEIALARLTQAPADPRAHAEVPDDIAELILHCLALEPGERPASALVVIAYLEGDPSPYRVAVPIASPGDQAIAVLPFSYRGPEGSKYLGEAIAEELVDVFGRTRGVKVLAFSATSKLGDNADPIEVCRQLGLAHAVLGSVQREGDEVRITARLIDSEGTQTWSEKHTGNIGDIFDFQERMSRRIAESLRLELTSVSFGHAPPEAIEAYFRLRRAFTRDGYGGVSESLAELDSIIEQAPSFEPAYSLHAMASARGWFAASVYDRKSRAKERAHRSIERALEKAKLQPETHLARGILAVQSCDFPTAGRAFARTLQIAPTIALAQYYLGMLLCEAGLSHEGVERLRYAQELDPNLVAVPAALARELYFQGKTDESHELMRELAGGAARHLSLTRVAIWEKNRAHLDMVASTITNDTPEAQLLALVVSYARGEMSAKMAVGLFNTVTSGIDNPRFRSLLTQIFAATHASHGDVERAITDIEWLIKTGFIDIRWLECCPALEPVRADPRFDRLARSVAEQAHEYATQEVRSSATWS